MKYYTTVEDQEYIIEIGPDEILVNGEPCSYDFQGLAEVGLVSLILNNRSLEAVVEERDGISEVLIRGELYSVRVQDERAYRLAKARGTVESVSGDAIIKSPMPGIVIATPVAEGDVVKKGDKVIILESMKMENELKSPRDGVVLAVETSPGVSVEKGQVLLVVGDPDDLNDMEEMGD
ncbi:MAG: biotin/lipoyl-binding protein [Anaerolineales bacterium]|nr:biotin/lipoyl-binding protein [Anaerolineales bacterium]